MEFFDFLGLRTHLSISIGVKFCLAKQTQVPLGHANFHVNRCNESPLQGENDFRPLSKFNIHRNSFPLCGNPANKKHARVQLHLPFAVATVFCICMWGRTADIIIHAKFQMNWVRGLGGPCWPKLTLLH